MSEKWTTVFPLPIRNTSFTWIPYWIYDIIKTESEAGRDWREYQGKYQLEIDTLKEAYNDYGDIDFIESRNGYTVKMSKYVVEEVTPTILNKDTITTDILETFSITDLFDISPSSEIQNAVMTSSNDNVVTISGENLIVTDLGGVSEITCQLENGSSAENSIIVNPPSVTSPHDGYGVSPGTFYTVSQFFDVVPESKIEYVSITVGNENVAIVDTVNGKKGIRVLTRGGTDITCKLGNSQAMLSIDS
ncbi:large outer capsid protein [Pectobacterium phage POP12]|nr:large outer capsid protein [Pectobacterium phage POP12]